MFYYYRNSVKTLIIYNHAGLGYINRDSCVWKVRELQPTAEQTENLTRKVKVSVVSSRVGIHNEDELDFPSFEIMLLCF